MLNSCLISLNAFYFWLRIEFLCRNRIDKLMLLLQICLNSQVEVSILFSKTNDPPIFQVLNKTKISMKEHAAI